MPKGFVECTDCYVWADIPPGFSELVHFVRCPKCMKPMYLVHVGKPSDVGLRESQRVVASLMSQ
jgi:hypothetical protein